MTYKKLPSYSLILHGWDERIPAESLLPLFEKYIVTAGIEPNHGSVKGKNPPELKGYSMRTVRKRIASAEFHMLNHLHLYHFLDKEDGTSQVFEISYDVSFGDENILFMNAVTPQLGKQEFALGFLSEILTYVSPYYGYMVEMPLGHSPFGFAHGISAPTEDAEIERYAWQQTSHAMFNGFSHKKGRFRHVFAQNILSPPHLENRIDGKPFEEWVKQSGRGRLEKWKDNVWVWSVPNEERIRIANILHFNGLLTAPDPFQNQLIG